HFGAFVLFGCIRDCLITLRNSMQNGPNKCKSSCHEVASEFFATNAPDPPHWTLNCRFGAFCTIWVHSGPFGCLTKLGAKRAELVQKFVPRSRVGIFGNERTRSSPLDPKLTFCCVSYYLGAFGTVCLPYETRCKLLVPRSRVGIFRNKCTRSTPLDPKLTFCCVSYYFVAFGTVWLPYETRSKTGRTSAKVRATKSRRNLSQRTHPIHPIGPQTDVLVRFILFGCIRDRFIALQNSVQNGPN